MTLLHPWALAFAGAIPVIVLLYLLKLKRQTVEVSTLMFWQRVLQENRRRALFQRLRNWLSLLLHLLIFLLILFALAKPEWRRFAGSGSSTIIIVDTRARMQANAGSGASRLERAKPLALGFVSRVGSGHEMALLSANAAPEVIVPFTDAEAPLKNGIMDLRATDGGGNLPDTIRLAEQLLAARGGGRKIVLFTDSVAAAAITSTQPLKVITIGMPEDNVAITRFAARSLPASQQTTEVMLEVRNFGREAANSRIEVTCDGLLLDVKPFQLGPGERMVELFPVVPARPGITRGWLVAKLAGSDALAVDNTAYAVLPGSHPRHILLVSKENWFLEKVFAADDRVQFELLTPESFQPDLAVAFDVVVFDDCLPAKFDFENFTGNYLFIKKTPLGTGDEALELPPVTDVDVLHPLMRLITFQDVRFARATRLADNAVLPGWKLQTVLRSFDHPLVVAGTRARAGLADQRFVAIAFAVAESDLPLRVAFPLFIANTIRWLAGEQVEINHAPRSGETVALSPSQTVSLEPHQATEGAAPEGAATTRGLFRPMQNGFYRISEPGKPDSSLAVNTFSPEESNLRAAPTADAARTSASLRRPAAPNWPASRVWNRPFWQGLALAALLLFALEWWLYHQRRTE